MITKLLVICATFASLVLYSSIAVSQETEVLAAYMQVTGGQMQGPNAPAGKRAFGAEVAHDTIFNANFFGSGSASSYVNSRTSSISVNAMTIDREVVFIGSGYTSFEKIESVQFHANASELTEIKFVDVSFFISWEVTGSSSVFVRIVDERTHYTVPEGYGFQNQLQLNAPTLYSTTYGRRSSFGEYAFSFPIEGIDPVIGQPDQYEARFKLSYTTALTSLTGDLHPKPLEASGRVSLVVAGASVRDAEGIVSFATDWETGIGASDFNGDGLTDGADFLAWQRGVGSLSATHADGDASGDGAIDAFDWEIWKHQYGQSSPPDLNAVPEPLPYVTLAIGIVTLVVQCRRISPQTRC